MIAGLVYGARGSYRGQDVLRILDPCCGEAVAQLAEQLRLRSSIPIETFGVELHRVRAEEAASRLDRALSTDLFQTSIGHGAFGLLYLNPPYDTDQEKKRDEHRFLTHCARYLAEDGLLVFIVPRRRLAVSARFLASHFWKLRCWAFPAPEREVFDQVVLIGYRRREPKLDEYALEKGREWSRESRRSYARTPIRSSTHRQHRQATSSSPHAPSIRWRPLGRPGGRGCGPAPRSPIPCGRRAVRTPDR